MIATVPLKVVAAISLALILLSSPILSKLTQGDYTVTVNLSGDRNGVNVTGLNSITTAVDIVALAT
jgi:hypothetical protein